MRLLVVLALAACNDSPASCPGAAPTKMLIEAYCKAGEADRCYYDQSPLDGF